MPKRATATASNPWQALADDWQRTGSQWMQWWTGAATHGPRARAGEAGECARADAAA